MITGRVNSAAGRKAIETHILQSGVRAREIRWHTEPLGGGRDETMRLSYTRSQVQVPHCGDWSDRMAFNPTNREYTNFGCVTRRNFGLAVARPADLDRMRRPDPRDTTRSDLAIKQYRTPESKATEGGELGSTKGGESGSTAENGSGSEKESQIGN